MKKRRKRRKLIIALTVIATIVTLMIGMKQQDNNEVSLDKITVPVAKIQEPDMLPIDSDKMPKIDEILNDPRLQGATTGISIRKASTGEIVYSNLGDTRVHPASVMKLLTGVAALETLGEDHTFKTELYMDGRIENGVIHGNLYLRGRGDPTLTKNDLKAFASELKARGIRSITGNVYGDDYWYDSIRLSQDLNWSDEPFYTGSQVSALTLSPNDDYDSGTVIVEVYPATKSGQAGKISMVPANNYLTIVNKTQTVAKKGKKSIQVERQHGSNTLIVSGTIPAGAKKTRTWSSVWEPTNYALNIFKEAVEQQGISFSITPKVGRKKVPKGASLVASKQSMPLKELFIPFLKLSNNGHAEVLVKEMGRVIGGVGSWDKGLAVMEGVLADMGLDAKNMLLRDGSGMSHKNLVTANEVTRLLEVAQKKPWYPTFLNALPVAGNGERFIGGTLRHRMKGTAAEGNVQAKTGALNGVAALSGYVTTKDGELLIFSVMVNNYLSDRTVEVLDAIAITLANYRK
ncbi:D-alanyl-D-alanine carboxypeptidase/D-alanyl-D-alanine-endopeptidase [Sporosarcina sp. ANT_H38]|uniref:D-alanyl-D-alanine carboxypeptidase/D-alanyl-D-alanine endopeptidase n=1 Tax=Sporosarcina sp. ANT_H38 TaxID=2597358 RepID=UPI0011F3BB8E|nr:D-alanyl-D-alanine carboxypeptidase/D-alanyl-D-alanine-endopeptidase [Sporosarcina sp. ANT_H38]KAA0948784.1 D-alanyl-D-alanine carboxypeptidase/D-alanyl-D-alanine-endopeptidase [Sporosarcina sp. ANT_H38]